MLNGKSMRVVGVLECHLFYRPPLWVPGLFLVPCGHTRQAFEDVWGYVQTYTDDGPKRAEILLARRIDQGWVRFPFPAG
jgi:hypothetical protein